MDKILQGLPNVICYIDDILVSGEDEASHFQSLEEVFTRLEKHGIRLKQEKCCFLLPKVEYLGHQISEEGIQPLANKVSAIIKAPIHTKGPPAVEIVPRPRKLLRVVHIKSSDSIITTFFYFSAVQHI